MKKDLCLFISFILLINYANAQKASLGFTAGATFASNKAKVESISVTSDIKVGFTAGLTISSPLGKNFALRPSLNFVQKGGKQTDEGSSDKTTFNYIELPLDFVFNASTRTGTFFIGAGPSLSIGLSGKDKWEYGSESGTDDIKFGSGDDADLKSFEAGIDLLAGYQFKGGFFVAANYNAGVNNIAPDDPQFHTKYHNRYFGIRIGCMFGKKAK